VNDKRVCPKCMTPMNALPVQCIIPTLFDPRNPDAPPSTTLKHGFPIQVYHCPKCRYIEMYGGEPATDAPETDPFDHLQFPAARIH